MKIVTYNLRYGVGRDGRHDLERIARALEGADIACLQEVTRNFMRNGGVDMVAGLSELMPDYFTAYGVAMDLDFGLRDRAGRPLNRRLEFGNMILSRWPIAASRNLLLPRTRRYDRGNLQRAALEALIAVPDAPLRVYCTHLDHIHLDERLRQIAWLLERVNGYGLEGGAISGAAEYGFPEPPSPEAYVLAGDLNCVPGSPEHGALVGRVDPVEGRETVAHLPVDAYAAGGGDPEAFSWHDEERPDEGRLIDHIMVHASLAPRIGKAWIDEEAAGSDHQPLWVELE